MANIEKRYADLSGLQQQAAERQYRSDLEDTKLKMKEQLDALKAAARTATAESERVITNLKEKFAAAREEVSKQEVAETLVGRADTREVPPAMVEVGTGERGAEVVWEGGKEEEGEEDRHDQHIVAGAGGYEQSYTYEEPREENDEQDHGSAARQRTFSRGGMIPSRSRDLLADSVARSDTEVLLLRDAHHHQPGVSFPAPSTVVNQSFMTSPDVAGARGGPPVAEEEDDHESVSGLLQTPAPAALDVSRMLNESAISMASGVGLADLDLPTDVRNSLNVGVDGKIRVLSAAELLQSPPTRRTPPEHRVSLGSFFSPSPRGGSSSVVTGDHHDHFFAAPTPGETARTAPVPAASPPSILVPRSSCAHVVVSTGLSGGGGFAHQQDFHRDVHADAPVAAFYTESKELSFGDQSAIEGVSRLSLPLPHGGGRYGDPSATTLFQKAAAAGPAVGDRPSIPRAGRGSGESFPGLVERREKYDEAVNLSLVTSGSATQAQYFTDGGGPSMQQPQQPHQPSMIPHQQSNARITPNFSVPPPGQSLAYGYMALPVGRGGPAMSMNPEEAAPEEVGRSDHVGYAPPAQHTTHTSGRASTYEEVDERRYSGAYEAPAPAPPTATMHRPSPSAPRPTVAWVSNRTPQKERREPLPQHSIHNNYGRGAGGGPRIDGDVDSSVVVGSHNVKIPTLNEEEPSSPERRAWKKRRGKSPPWASQLRDILTRVLDDDSSTAEDERVRVEGPPPPPQPVMSRTRHEEHQRQQQRQREKVARAVAGDEPLIRDDGGRMSARIGWKSADEMEHELDTFLREDVIATTKSNIRPETEEKELLRREILKNLDMFAGHRRARAEEQSAAQDSVGGEDGRDHRRQDVPRSSREQPANPISFFNDVNTAAAAVPLVHQLYRQKEVLMSEQNSLYRSDCERLSFQLEELRSQLEKERELREAADRDVSKLLDASALEKKLHTDIVENLKATPREQSQSRRGGGGSRGATPRGSLLEGGDCRVDLRDEERKCSFVVEQEGTTALMAATREVVRDTRRDMYSGPFEAATGRLEHSASTVVPPPPHQVLRAPDPYTVPRLSASTEEIMRGASSAGSVVQGGGYSRGGNAVSNVPSSVMIDQSMGAGGIQLGSLLQPGQQLFLLQQPQAPATRKRKKKAKSPARARSRSSGERKKTISSGSSGRAGNKTATNGKKTSARRATVDENQPLAQQLVVATAVPPGSNSYVLPHHTNLVVGPGRADLLGPSDDRSGGHARKRVPSATRNQLLVTPLPAFAPPARKSAPGTARRRSSSSKHRGVVSRSTAERGGGKKTHVFPVGKGATLAPSSRMISGRASYAGAALNASYGNSNIYSRRSGGSAAGRSSRSASRSASRSPKKKSSR